MTEKTKTENKAELNARFAREMTETVEGMRAGGIMDEPTYKQTMRDLNREGTPDTVVSLTGADIRAMRERAKLSQAVFARYLHLTVDHVSKLERGTKRPTGPALVLLNVIQRKGMEAIL
jgi:putative transcriptional regulator